MRQKGVEALRDLLGRTMRLVRSALCVWQIRLITVVFVLSQLSSLIALLPLQKTSADTAPTVSDYKASTWSDLSTGSEVTGTLTWSANDLIVVVGATENGNQTLGTPTATGLSFSLITSINVDDFNDVVGYLWTATAGSSSSGAITSTAGGGGNSARGIAAYAFTGSSGIGTPVTLDNSANKVISLTRANANSAVVEVLGDWNAVNDTAITTDPVGGNSRQAVNVSASVTFFQTDWGDQGAAGTTNYGIGSHTGTVDMSGLVVEVKGTAASLEQEGYRWRADDGSESAATWLASQDTNITRPANTNTRLRMLLNATDNPASAQYQLEYRLSAGAYSKVLTSQPTTTLPTYVNAGTIAAGTGTIAPALPASILADDILIMFAESANEAISISDQNGGTWTEASNSPQGTGTAAGTSATRLAVFWSRYNGTQGAPTLADSGDHTIGRMIAVRGCITTGDPFDVSAGNVHTTSDTSGSIPGGTTTVDNTFVVTAITGSADAGVNDTAGFASWTNSDLANLTERIDNRRTAGNGGLLGVATGEKAANGTYGNTTVTLANASVKGLWTGALKPAAVTQEAILMSASSNITASGANTTAQLTAPSGKTTFDFVAGRIQDDENPADAVDITTDDYTELEWSLTAVGTVVSNSEVYQFRVTNNGAAINTYTVTPQWTIGSANTAPSSPTSATQKKTDDTVLATGDWTSETSIKLTATVTDSDGGDTISICAEVDPVATAFSSPAGDGDGCSASGVSTGGTATVTISGLSDGTEYHWQIKAKDAAGAYSSWVTYGGNTENPPTNPAARDFGVDTSAPTGGTVYDGTTTDVDKTFSDSSLSALSANWSGFSFTAAGIQKYEYSIGTTAGGTDIKNWTNNSTTASVTATGLTLQTSIIYYFNVKAYDNAGNNVTRSSNGQLVAPSLSFSISPTSLTFSNLNAANSYTDTEPTTLTTSTNAYGGYVVRLAATDYLRSTASFTIPDFTGGTYASPDSWQSGDTGFGYTSDDTTIQGSNKFQAAICPGGSAIIAPGCYAPYNQTKPGDIVADHTSNVTGSPITNEQFTLTHRLTVGAAQQAQSYSAILLYTITALY